MKTMVVNLKRIIMCCLMFVIVSAVFAQDYQVKHEVRRGETLASIAKQYGLTEQMIKDANPQMGDLFYVGLKLNIPKDEGVNTNVENVENEVTNSFNDTFKKEQSSSYSTSYNAALNNSTDIVTNDEDYVRANDMSLNLHFDDPFTLGLGFGADSGKYGYLYLGGGFSSYNGDSGYYDDMSTGSTILGYGAKQRFRYGAFLLQIIVFPYAGFAWMDYHEGKENKTDYDFAYGAAGNISVGLKAWNTSKGNETFITIGYYVDAPEFKTQDMFKNGSWMFGLTIVLNN